jgi:hypothetical protein
MKIEIEYEDIEKLKKQLVFSQNEVAELKAKMSLLSEDKLKQDAVNLSERLLNDYLATIFDKLGLTTNNRPVNFECGLKAELGSSWWQSERLSVTIGATVTSEFKRAFLNIGVITDEI